MRRSLPRMILPRVTLPRVTLVVGLIVAGCSNTSIGPLLVQSAEGGLSALGLDGTTFPIHEETAGVALRQPTWSPDARIAVWTEIVAAEQRTAIGMGDATRQRRIDVPTPPFYYSWSPQGDRVAYLGNSPDGQGVALGLVEVADGTANLVDGGNPYYFDWQPDGSRLVIHVAGRVLAFLAFDGTRTDIPVETGMFQAPAFLPDGRLLVITAGPPQSLSVLDVLGNPTELAPVEGWGMFAPNSSGDRVAYIDSPPGSGLGALRVLDIAGGEPTVIDQGQVVGFTWDPAGLKLLYFAIDVEAGELVPKVWNGSDVIRYPGFVPSSTFVSEYLPFWDQYSRSLSLWSPDGDAFVVPDASDRILVQHLDEETPTEVGSGVFATWGG